MSTPRKIRIDHLLVERGLVDSRQKAQALIMTGQVLAADQKVEKCGHLVPADVPLRVLGETPRYVSRAGLKLEGALDHFGVDPGGKVCADIGASTGGFTDCLLQRGARRVFSLDVGTNQLDWRLRHDPRVVSIEKTNARYLQSDALSETVDLVTIDVSFISVTLILPAIPQLLSPRADILVLAKPQFEVGRGQVGKGGVVRDPKLHQEAVARVGRKLAELGFSGIDSEESVLPGASGNREFFVRAVWWQNRRRTRL